MASSAAGAAGTRSYTPAVLPPPRQADISPPPRLRKDRGRCNSWQSLMHALSHNEQLLLQLEGGGPQRAAAEQDLHDSTEAE
jgi:hypothetical protein